MRDAPDQPPRQVNGVVGLPDTAARPPPASGEFPPFIAELGCRRRWSAKAGQ
jgi:hypothetical protein